MAFFLPGTATSIQFDNSGSYFKGPMDCLPRLSRVDTFRRALCRSFSPADPGRRVCAIDDLLADRDHHLAMVRQMFEECDVFVFTLGLTEGWASSVDGAVYPLAPGTVAEVRQQPLRISQFLGARDGS